MLVYFGVVRFLCLRNKLCADLLGEHPVLLGAIAVPFGISIAVEKVVGQVARANDGAWHDAPSSFSRDRRVRARRQRRLLCGLRTAIVEAWGQRRS